METKPTKRQDKDIARAEGPSHAERARTIVSQSGVASLATMAVDPAGYPFVSIVRFTLGPDGSPLLSLSDLAEHAQNLAQDNRASIMVTEQTAHQDPLAAGRVTLIGTCATVSPEERQAARDRYLAAHPSAFYVDFADFKLYRIDVVAVRYVGGFGRMSWVPATEYATAEADPIAESATEILEHMNADHPDTLLLYARALYGIPDATSATASSVDRDGMDVEVTSSGGPKTVRVSFDRRAGTPDDVRNELIRLARAAREQQA